MANKTVRLTLDSRTGTLSTSNLYPMGGLFQAPVVPHNRPPQAKPTAKGEQMHVLLTAYSWRGDVEPMMGLAVRFRTFGAEVWV